MRLKPDAPASTDAKISVQKGHRRRHRGQQIGGSLHRVTVSGSRTRHPGLSGFKPQPLIPKRAESGTDTQRRRTWGDQGRGGHRYTEEEDTGRPRQRLDRYTEEEEKARTWQRLEGEVYQPRAASDHWKLVEGRKDPPGALEGLGLRILISDSRPPDGETVSVCGFKPLGL